MLSHNLKFYDEDSPLVANIRSELDHVVAQRQAHWTPGEKLRNITFRRLRIGRIGNTPWMYPAGAPGDAFHIDIRPPTSIKSGHTPHHSTLPAHIRYVLACRCSSAHSAASLLSYA